MFQKDDVKLAEIVDRNEAGNVSVQVTTGNVQWYARASPIIS